MHITAEPATDPMALAEAMRECRELLRAMACREMSAAACVDRIVEFDGREYGVWCCADDDDRENNDPACEFYQYGIACDVLEVWATFASPSPGTIHMQNVILRKFTDVDADVDAVLDRLLTLKLFNDDADAMIDRLQTLRM